METRRFSAKGRPRLLGEREIARILGWHSNRMTLKDLARELKVSEATVRGVIRSNGQHYKQPPPERREEVLREIRLMRTGMAMEGGR